jgi:predicted nucleotidyltransferase
MPLVLGSHRTPEAVLMPYARYRELADADSVAPTLDGVRRYRELILRLARANRIDAVAVFGSLASGEATPESDVDLLVDPHEDATLFDLAQFELDLEQLLGRSVDVVSRRSLDPIRDRSILRGLVAL